MRGPLPIPGSATEQLDKDHDVGEPPTLSRPRGCCRTEPPQCSQEAWTAGEVDEPVEGLVADTALALVAW